MLTPAAECSTCCASQGSWPFSIRFSPTGVDTHKGDNRTTAPRGATPRTGRLSRRPRGNLRWCGSLDLLSTPLTIPLMGCQINSFRRVSSCGETMARRRKEERRAGTASPGMSSDWVVAPPVCGPWGVPACGVVPERCHAVGAAVDAHRDTPAWVHRAERTGEGGVVAVPRARSVSPRAPCITAPRVARFHPSSTRNCLPPKP